MDQEDQKKGKFQEIDKIKLSSFDFKHEGIFTKNILVVEKDYQFQYDYRIYSGRNKKAALKVDNPYTPVSIALFVIPSSHIP